MATAIIGALIGTISMGATAGYIFGATLWASVFAGAMMGASLGSFFSSDFDTSSNSPTYSFGEVANTKTQKLPIPLVLGGPCRVAGNVFYEKFHDDSCRVVDRYIGISAGPVKSIVDVKADDNLITGIKGCTLSVYLNSDSLTKDKRDPSGTRPYPDGIAFICMTLEAGEKLNGSSAITSIVRGIRVWTPEADAIDGSQGKIYTNNPAWLIYYLLTDKTNGIGIPKAAMDLDSFIEAADYYAERVKDEPRYTLSYVIDTQKAAVDVLTEILSTCFSYIIARDMVRLVVDKPVDTYYKTVGADQIIAGSFSWWQKADDEIYNRVIVEWTDPANSYEQVVTIYEDSKDIESRGVYEQSYKMVGCTSVSQANRSGARLLDAAQNICEYCSFQLSLKDADIEAGDVIALTHDLAGWRDKWVRVLSVTDENTDDDLISITCCEYIASVYDDTAMNVPVHIDTGFKDPFASVMVENFTVELVRNLTVFTWDSIDNSFVHVSGYEIRRGSTWKNGTVIAKIPGAGTSSYERHYDDRDVAKFWIAATGAYTTQPVSFSLTHGLAAPMDISGLQAIQDGSYIDLFWDTNNEADFDHYEVRAGYNWGTGSVISALLFESSTSILVSAVRSYGFMVKAVNSAGIYSVNATLATVTVSELPPTNILVEWGMPTSNTGVCDKTVFLRNPCTWATQSGKWNSDAQIKWVDFGSELVLALAEGAQIGTFTSNQFDLARVVTANLGYDIFAVTNDASTLKLEIRTSVNNETWSAWEVFLPHSAKLRFLQYRVTLTRQDVTVPVPYMTYLYVSADMPDVIKNGRSVVLAGGSVIDYGFEYAVTPTLVVTADGALYSAKVVGEPGFNSALVKVIDQNGFDISGTINWASYGY